MSLGKPLHLTVVAAIVFVTNITLAQEKRLIQPSDCAGVRYLATPLLQEPIQINSQGTHAAYLTEVANLENNRDDIELSIIDINTGGKSQSKIVLTDSVISQITWLEDGKHLTFLADFDGHVSVVKFDATTSEHEVLASSDQDIVEYTIDHSGNTIVFATEEPLGNLIAPRTSAENAKGYRVPVPHAEAAPRPERKLYVTRTNPDGTWDRPEPLIIRSPTNGRSISAFSYAPPLSLRLSLSPNGRFLLTSYFETQIPEDWKTKASVRPNVVIAGFVSITAMTDLASGITTLPLKTIWMSSLPLWSPDSRSFVAVAKSPLDSKWEAEDVSNRLTNYNAIPLCLVAPRTF